MMQGNQACVSQLLSPHITTLLKPLSLEAMLYTGRSHSNKKPADTHNEEQPLPSLQLEKACSTAMKAQYNRKTNR